MIRFENVSKTYKNGTPALKDISLNIEKGEFVFLVGASGSGKTTFLRLLLREELPDRGRILEAGRDLSELSKWRVPYLRRNIGCVFQDFRLLPNKTVFENVAFALEVIGRPRSTVDSQVPQILELVGLSEKAKNLPGELSGGEQQRVAVARAFVNRPLILLADEPTGNLDPTNSESIMALLERINRTGTTVVMATHDKALVDRMRRRVVELDRGEVVRDQVRGVYGIDEPAGESLMRVYLRYAVKETLGNLWRNRMMTIAAVLTVAVSLSLVGAALLLKQSAAQASAQWQQGTRVTVWMQPTASASELASVRSQLASLPIVKDCAYYSQAQDYQEAKIILPASEWSVLTVSDVPSSFRCVPTVPSNAFVVESTFKNQSGVLTVTAPEQQIREMNRAIRILQIVFLALAGVLLLSATVLILNTIRMAIFARRREVSVMKLVGATNWFIRIPYITEGFIQGLLGSAVAIAAVTALHTWYPLHNEFQLNTTALLGTNAVVLVVGVVVGSVGSALAIRRFLDV